MGEVLRSLENSPALREFLKSRVPDGQDSVGCAPNCRLILEDLETNGKFTGWPRDAFGGATYPIESKLIHLILEFNGEIPHDYASAEDLASVVAHLLDTRN